MGRRPGLTRRTYGQQEAVASALDAVGDRWTLLLVEALLAGPRRFGDLQDELPGIASNVLAERLRRLESEGVVLAQPYCERPPRTIAAWQRSR